MKICLTKRSSIALDTKPSAAPSGFLRTCRHVKRATVPRLRCCEDNATENSVEVTSPKQISESSSSGSGGGNAWLAVGAVAFAAGSLFVVKSMDGGPALERLRSMSMPLEAALTNKRPTVLEFYADWCEVCNELAPMTLEVEEEYKDRVNFVMLNVENTKWAPEAAEYGVRGIPHFVFLNEKGSPEAAAVGRLPREVLEGDVRALAASDPLPFRNNRGPTSGLARPENSTAMQKNPRDHS